MITTRLVNVQYGKWNAVIAKQGNHARLFAVDPLLFLPETLAEWIAAIRSIPPDGGLAPLRMDIDVTNHCNNDCVMCFARQLRHDLPQRIPYRQLERIFQEFRALGGVSVRLTGGGECMTHPDFLRILECLHGLDLKISIQTNGDGLSRPRVRQAVAQFAHSLRVSVNSFDNQSRRLVHRSQNQRHTYDALIQHIREVMTAASACGREADFFPGATFVVLPENYLGIEKFVADMAAIGMRWVAIRENIQRTVYEENPHILPSMRAQLARLPAYPNMIVAGQYQISYAPAKNFSTCWISYLRPVILANSSLHLCCAARNQPDSVAAVGSLGDGGTPLQTTLDENTARLEHFRRVVPEQCRICIDPAANHFIEQVRAILTHAPDTTFSPALVKLDGGASLDPSTGLPALPLAAQEFARFSQGELVDYPASPLSAGC